MTKPLLAIIGLLLAGNLLPGATNSPADVRASTNASAIKPGSRAETVAIENTQTNDPVELEFRKIMQADDDAQAEVDQWIQDNQKFAEKGAGEPNAELNKRILARFQRVSEAYENFLAHHTNHARAHLAYAGFLSETKDEHAALPHMEKSRDLDPTNPAVWNNLANYWGHYGEPTKAFEFYTKAIELDPEEPVYYHNFGTTVYLFRKDAREYYHIEEQQVFDKALVLYSNSLRLDPTNFPIATDVAQSFYGIRPFRPEPALRAWTNALAVAHDDIEREGTYLHFARINWMAGRTNVAAGYLHLVTNTMYADLKRKIQSNLAQPFVEWMPTNAPVKPPEK